MDQIELPQRPCAVERPRHDSRDLLGQLLVAPRRGQRELTDVEVEVELGVVDPVRIIEPERHLGEPPAERGQKRQALLHQPLDVAAVELAARCRGLVQYRHARHVTGLACALQREELRVNARELPHSIFPLAGQFGRIRTWHVS